MCKGGERKHLNVAWWDGVFLHPWTVSRRQVCPRGEATSLSLRRPFSPLPTVTCYLRSPRHMCTSLEQGYSYLCLQEVCSVFPAFKWLNRTFRLLYGNLTNASHLGKHERNWCFPPSTGLMRGWQRRAPNLRCRNSRTGLYWALSPRGQSWSALALEISIILECSIQLCPRANLEFSTSVPLPSNSSMVTYLLKVSSNIFFSLGFRFLLWMILGFNLNFWVVYLTYAH